MSTLTPLLGSLRPVGLEELVDRASLMHRTDRKYLVPVAAAEHLIRTLETTLDDGLRVLEIDGRRTFGYRSTYLDTPDLAGFHGAATGRRRRFKVRRRDYLDTGTAYLEVKTRTGRGEAVKERVLLPDRAGGAWTRPTAPEVAFVVARLEEAGIATPVAELVPVLATGYRRTTLLVADEGSRITMDTGLSWEAPPAGTPATAALRGLVVVETKAGTRPGRADRVLWAGGHRPRRLSKYATGLALLQDLPANRWQRTLHTLRTDLAPAPGRLAG